MLPLAVLVLSLLQTAPAQVAPKPSADGVVATAKKVVVIPTDAEAITMGVAQIVSMQEKGPGSDIAAQWPYEGVYRVGGNIPFGYRVGGTSIASMA